MPRPSSSPFLPIHSLCIDGSPWGSAVVTQTQCKYSFNSPRLPLWEPICPIAGSKEALCRANEIKAHLAEGINRADRFNRPKQREGGQARGVGAYVWTDDVDTRGYYYYVRAALFFDYWPKALVIARNVCFPLELFFWCLWVANENVYLPSVLNNAPNVSQVYSVLWIVKCKQTLKKFLA